MPVFQRVNVWSLRNHRALKYLNRYWKIDIGKPSFTSLDPRKKRFAKEKTDEAKDVRDRELIMRRIGRTKNAAFARRWAEQRIFAVTGLYIQQSRETDYGTVYTEFVRVNKGGASNRIERLRRSNLGGRLGTQCERHRRGDRCTGLVSCRGASTRGPVLFSAQR